MIAGIGTVAGDEDHPLGQLRLAALERLVELDPVDVGHPEVTEHQIEGALAQPLQRSPSARHRLHAMPFALQGLDEPLADERIVVDDQDAGCAWLGPAAPMQPLHAPAQAPVHAQRPPRAALADLAQRPLRAVGGGPQDRRILQDRAEAAVVAARAGPERAGRRPTARVLVDLHHLSGHDSHVVVARDEGVDRVRDLGAVGLDLVGELRVGELAAVGPAGEVSPAQLLEPVGRDEAVASVVVVDEHHAPGGHRLERAPAQTEHQVGLRDLVLHRPRRVAGSRLPHRHAQLVAHAPDLRPLPGRHVVGEDQGPAGAGGDRSPGAEPLHVDPVADDHHLAGRDAVPLDQVIAHLLADRDVPARVEGAGGGLLLPRQDPMAGEDHGPVRIARPRQQRLVTVVRVDDVHLGRRREIRGHRHAGRHQALRDRAEPRTPAHHLVAQARELDREGIEVGLGAAVVVEGVVGDEDLHPDSTIISDPYPIRRGQITGTHVPATSAYRSPDIDSGRCDPTLWLGRHRPPR